MNDFRSHLAEGAGITPPVRVCASVSVGNISLGAMAAQKGSEGNQGVFGGAAPGENRGGVFGTAKPNAREIGEFDNKVSDLVMRKGILMQRIRQVTGTMGALSADHSDNMKLLQE